MVPLPQYPGPAPICPINYTPECIFIIKIVIDTLGYFRAIVHSHELSERALSLTKDVINLSPANFTAWQYRRQCLRALNKDLVEELKENAKMVVNVPKNYQIWFHRQSLIQDCGYIEEELSLVRRVLSSDSKNYHAWQHRQWVLQFTNNYSDELEFVDELINEDVRNNSAWNQRWFVLKNTHV